MSKKVTMNKTKAVLEYLESHDGITSLEAINLFGATRLSAIIFNLRKQGHNIVNSDISILDRFGNHCTYTKYSLVKDI